ncbi:MAG TPA: class I SAM-dependent RNA methyltransferase [Kiritimatiellia bacterium]|jgi:putative N6-adenine-specific DNA methylase|nr:class I SAM-dependent RNA methyltransferase [Kiritimatiellia bacterium]HOR98544.1 class I SAM-dependent RNA methyltransferase [Kiritimatiellia bacterium]HPW74853.1 class I SAM-dependent RNA methyltransferase [Kiritimatiellia bacterium]HRU19585.1 class I SAM-dependent RNA methyltransferase [Kiritimatiellia bacterium]
MNLWKDTYPLIISCARGLAPQTVGELKRLGYRIVDTTAQTVVVRGTMRDMMTLNLRLRTAHRVLAPLLRTECRNLREFYDDVKSIDWENLLEPDGYFTVNSVTRTDAIRDTRMAALKAKDAIADRMRQQCGSRPDSGRETHGAAIFVYWQRTELIIYLDTTGGEPLSKRGYRITPGTAPLQETLAAGCVLASGWDANSPFVVPMCGSGTPAIEAALLALNRAPGSFKSHFGFMAIKGYRITIPGERAGASVRQRFGASPEQIWKDMVATARDQERREGLPPILATDIDPETLESARLNAIAAGVSEHITFAACDFEATQLPPPPGVIFLNPPYGQRLASGVAVESTAETDAESAADEPASGEALEPLYRRIGDFFKRQAVGYTGCVLTGNLELSRRIGLRSSRRIPFFNGPIECRMLVFDLFEGTLKEAKKGNNPEQEASCTPLP